MLRVIDCLVLDHDYRLVLLAAAVCVLGTIATQLVSDRAVRGERSFRWLSLSAVCGGSTVWTTHFIAVLAYKTGIPMTYDALFTSLSFAAGVSGVGLGLWLALARPGDTRHAAAGGATIGLAVATLHYLGMASLRFPGHLIYDATLVTASIAISAGLGAAGLYVATCRWRQAHARSWSVALLVGMTVSLHFTGMGALELELHPQSVDAGLQISRGMLLIAVTVAALTVLAICVASAFVDKRVTLRLAAEAERFRTLADGAREGLVVHSNGLVVDANAAAQSMFGWQGVPGGHSIDDWLDQSNTRWNQLTADEPMEVLLPGADGARFPAELCRRNMRLANGVLGELLTIRDLTQRKESEARIAHLALHDPLTDLPNRRLFMELASKAISHARRRQQRFAVLTIDLDGFKLVNDMYGHAAGDEVLKTVAARMSATIRDADVFSRFGGDEFCILQSMTAQPTQSMALAERLLDVVSAPIRLRAAEVTVSASIGIALFPDDGHDVDDLLRNADTAMYRAKADGKATCRFFEAQMDAALEARRRLEIRLRQAVVEERLEVAFQPLVSSDTHAPLGFEALVRWNDADLGAISPADFIPVAEETGLIIAIGELVMRRACREAAAWSQPLRVAVNLSAIQFRRKGLVEMVGKALQDSGLPGHRLELEVTESLLIDNRDDVLNTLFRRKGLVEMVGKALQDSGLPGHRLELEVTESLLIDNRDDVLNTLTALKTLGVRIAMDDFGTGYSSLSYLQSFPFDKIKIDRVFVSELGSSAQNASIVKAVTSMGKSLNMRVVAEGVETPDQARVLRSLECDELQGYLIARPMPAAEVERFLAEAARPATQTARVVGEGRVRASA